MRVHASSRLRKAVMIAAVLILRPEVHAFGIGLHFSPANISAQVRPGETINRQLTIALPANSRPVRFKTRIEDWWRSADNNQTFYAAPGTIARSCGPWCSVNPTETTVNPGQKLEIKVTMRVPGDVTPGGYWAALTVDEVPDPLAPKPTGVGMVFRTSLSVGLFAEVTPVTKAASITNVRVSSDRVAVTVRNDGNVPLRLNARFEFYKPGEDQPLAKVEIGGEPLLPGPVNTCEFSGRLPSTCDLPSGKYRVRAIVDVGLDYLMGAEKELEISRPSHV